MYYLYAVWNVFVVYELPSSQVLLVAYYKMLHYLMVLWAEESLYLYLLCANFATGINLIILMFL